MKFPTLQSPKTVGNFQDEQEPTEGKQVRRWDHDRNRTREVGEVARNEEGDIKGTGAMIFKRVK